MSTEEILFCLLRNEICGEDLPKNFNLEENVKRLYRLSKMHDIAHLIGDALIRNDLLSENNDISAFREQIILAVLRYEQQDVEFKKICKILEKTKISYIPLKGSLIRTYYPEGWMRTCCDIDILIHEEDIETAKQALLENDFETDSKTGFHDMHFYCENINLELHFSICENNKQLDKMLSRVWEYSEQIGAYEYRELPEFFVFHHIAHMAYHFLSGGCGIRPFIDLWILKKNNFYKEEKLLPFLEKCNLVKFYNSVCELINVWLTGKEHNDITLQLERYILIGGVYGSSENENKIGAAASKGKKRYLLKIAFPPYATMKVLYPSLKKHKLLLPFYYIHRIFSKIFGKDRKKVKSRVNNTFSQSEEKISAMSDLLKELELRR